MLCINIPLFFLGMHFFGSKYGLKVFVGATMLSVWTSVLGAITGYRGVLDYTDTTNVLISAICYGVLVGGGIGIVMRAGANTGGTDILAQIVAKFTPFNVGSIEFCMNACVVLCGGFFFGIRNTIFAFIAMYISGQMISYVVVKWGTSLAKTAYIFSNDRVPDISRRVIRELHHGGTLFKGTGIYTSKDQKDMLWPDMTWCYILAYDLWNFEYTYNCLPTHSWYCGLALLLAPTFANHFWNKGGWIQNRANTLALWCMFAQVFPLFQDKSIFTTIPTIYADGFMDPAIRPTAADPTAQGVVAIVALVVNVVILAVIIKRAKEQKKNPYKQEVFTDQKDFQEAMARV